MLFNIYGKRKLKCIRVYLHRDVIYYKICQENVIFYNENENKWSKNLYFMQFRISVKSRWFFFSTNCADFTRNNNLDILCNNLSKLIKVFFVPYILKSIFILIRLLKQKGYWFWKIILLKMYFFFFVLQNKLYITI